MRDALERAREVHPLGVHPYQALEHLALRRDRAACKRELDRRLVAARRILVQPHHDEARAHILERGHLLCMVLCVVRRLRQMVELLARLVVLLRLKEADRLGLERLPDRVGLRRQLELGLGDDGAFGLDVVLVLLVCGGGCAADGRRRVRLGGLDGLLAAVGATGEGLRKRERRKCVQREV